MKHHARLKVPLFPRIAEPMEWVTVFPIKPREADAIIEHLDAQYDRH